MLKLSVLIISIILHSMFCACKKTELDKTEATVNISAEKDCLPDAGSAGCPDAYGKVISRPETQKSDSLKEEPLITFVELGSVNCIPCKKMQPVMKSIEEKYGDQIKVIFYDVWKSDQRKYANEYRIRLIPTQVFINKDGEEIFRHEGFFPEQEIDVFLLAQCLNPKI